MYLYIVTFRVVYSSDQSWVAETDIIRPQSHCRTMPLMHVSAVYGSEASIGIDEAPKIGEFGEKWTGDGDKGWRPYIEICGSCEDDANQAQNSVEKHGRDRREHDGNHFERWTVMPMGIGVGSFLLFQAAVVEEIARASHIKTKSGGRDVENNSQ